MLINNIDQTRFNQLVEAHRHELHVHCYRMMGSVEDAEDMVQETFIRAWKKLDSLQDVSALRAWLYRIATNICLDTLKSRSRRFLPQTHEPVSALDKPIPDDVNDPIWIQPYPDEFLNTESAPDPAVTLSQKEHITLAFIAVIQLLPPQQRAVLLLRDVLNWKAREVADLLETTVSSVKSALFRARKTLDSHQNLLEHTPYNALDKTGKEQLDRYLHAWENADIDTLVTLLKDDATFSMPPIPSWYRGVDNIRLILSSEVLAGADATGRWKLISTSANGQSAFAMYLRDETNNAYQFYGVQLVTIDENKISNIITFRYPQLFSHFDCAEQLSITD